MIWQKKESRKKNIKINIYFVFLKQKYIFTL